MKKIKEIMIIIYRKCRDWKWSVWGRKHDQEYLKILEQRRTEKNDSVYLYIDFSMYVF